MLKVDRRILKSQEAIKTAFLELMAEKNFDDITIKDITDRANVSRGTLYLHYTDKFDLLNKLIQEHINAMRDICDSADDLDYKEGNLHCFQYLESHYLFISTMLASKGAPAFRSQYTEFLIEEFREEMNTLEGKNRGLHDDVILQFIVASYVGIVEWWIMNGMPHPPDVMAKEVGVLSERIL